MYHDAVTMNSSLRGFWQNHNNNNVQRDSFLLFVNDTDPDIVLKLINTVILNADIFGVAIQKQFQFEKIMGLQVLDSTAIGLHAGRQTLSWTKWLFCHLIVN